MIRKSKATLRRRKKEEEEEGRRRRRKRRTRKKEVTILGGPRPCLELEELRAVNIFRDNSGELGEAETYTFKIRET